MNTTDQRTLIDWMIQRFRFHRDNATETMKFIQTSEERCAQVTRDLVFGDIQAIVNVDGLRLLEAVEKVLALADQNASVSSGELIRVISLALRTHYEDD